MDRFGSDKPDLRFGMEIVDLGPRLVDSSGTPTSGFRVFDETLAAGGRVKAIVAPGMAGATRREIDELTEQAKRFGAKGLAYLALEPGGDVKGPIAKFLSDELTRSLVDEAAAAEGDLVLIVADRADVVSEVLGRLRVELGGRLGLADPDVLAYCWVHRFPMYKWDVDGGRWDATHNPFSGVVPEDEELLVTASGDPSKPRLDDPAGRARALQYDVVLNGWELGGGSIRIWRRDLLERSFGLQGYSLEQMHEQFGAVLEAFDYGAAAARRDRDRDRSLGGAPLAPDEHPRSHGLPEDPVGHGPHARRAVAARRRAARGTRPAVRRRAAKARPGRQGRGRLLTEKTPAAPSADLPWPLAAIAARPRLAALLGAMCIAFSGIFYRYAEVSPSTGTVFRCLFGLPLLGRVA